MRSSTTSYASCVFLLKLVLAVFFLFENACTECQDEELVVDDPYSLRYLLPQASDKSMFGEEILFPRESTSNVMLLFPGGATERVPLANVSESGFTFYWQESLIAALFYQSTIAAIPPDCDWHVCPSYQLYNMKISAVTKPSEVVEYYGAAPICE